MRGAASAIGEQFSVLPADILNMRAVGAGIWTANLSSTITADYTNWATAVAWQKHVEAWQNYNITFCYVGSVEMWWCTHVIVWDTIFYYYYSWY